MQRFDAKRGKKTQGALCVNPALGAAQVNFLYHLFRNELFSEPLDISTALDGFQQQM